MAQQLHQVTEREAEKTASTLYNSQFRIGSFLHKEDICLQKTEMPLGVKAVLNLC